MLKIQNYGQDSTSSVQRMIFSTGKMTATTTTTTTIFCHHHVLPSHQHLILDHHHSYHHHLNRQLLAIFFWDAPGENLSQQSPYIPPAPDSPPLPSTSNLRPKRQSDMATNTTQTLQGDHLTGEPERLIEKEKPNKNIVPDNDIVFWQQKIPTIFDNDDLRLKKSRQLSQRIKKQTTKIRFRRYRMKSIWAMFLQSMSSILEVGMETFP